MNEQRSQFLAEKSTKMNRCKRFKSNHLFFANNLHAFNHRFDRSSSDSKDDFDLPDLDVDPMDCGNVGKLAIETKRIETKRIAETGRSLTTLPRERPHLSVISKNIELKTDRRSAKKRNITRKSSVCQTNKQCQRIICRKNSVSVIPLSVSHPPYRLTHRSFTLCGETVPEWIVLTPFSMPKQLLLDVYLESTLSQIFSHRISPLLLSFCADNHEPPPATSELLLGYLGQLTNTSRAYPLYAALMEIACVKPPRNALPFPWTSLREVLTFCVEQIGHGTDVDRTYQAKVLSLEYMVSCLEFEIVNHGLWKYKRKLQSSQCYKLFASDAKMEAAISDVRWQISSVPSRFIKRKPDDHLPWRTLRLFQRLTHLSVFVSSAPLSKAEKQASDLARVYDKTSMLKDRLSMLRLAWCPLQRMLLSRHILDSKFYRRRSLINWNEVNIRHILRNYFKMFMSTKDCTDPLVLKSEEDAEEFVTSLYFLVESCIHVINDQLCVPIYDRNSEFHADLSDLKVLRECVRCLKKRSLYQSEDRFKFRLSRATRLRLMMLECLGG